MVYVPPQFKESGMTTQQKVDALNALETQAANGISYIDAYYHDDIYYTKTISDATFYRRAAHPLGRSDGPGSLLNAARIDGYTKADLQALAIPSGAIALWAKSVASIPVTWLFMNGTNNTIDTRGRVMMCAGGDYSPGTLGGAASVTPHMDAFDVDPVALTTNQIPKHGHTYSDKYNPGASIFEGFGGFANNDTTSTDTTTGVNGFPNTTPSPHGHPGSTFTWTGWVDDQLVSHSGALAVLPKSRAYPWILKR